LNESYLDRVKNKRQAEAERKRRELELQKSNETVKESSKTVAFEVARQSAKNRTTTQNVKVENEDLAKKEDIDAVINQLKEVQLASLLSGQNKPSIVLADSTDLGDRVESLGSQITQAIAEFKNDKSQTQTLTSLANEYKAMFKALEQATTKQADNLNKAISSLETSFNSKDFNPSIKVAPPKVEIPPADNKALTTALSNLESAVKSIKLDVPQTDFSDLQQEVGKVTSAINGLSFPVPNYVLPFRDSDGVAIQKTIERPDERLFERVSNTNGNSTALTSFSAVSGKKNYIKGYSITNTSSTNGYVDFRDGTSGSVLWTVPIPANGGANVMLDEPIFWTSANTALAFDVSGALTTVYISVTGYQS
jgi:hypothetical protein